MKKNKKSPTPKPEKKNTASIDDKGGLVSDLFDLQEKPATPAKKMTTGQFKKAKRQFNLMMMIGAGIIFRIPKGKNRGKLGVPDFYSLMKKNSHYIVDLDKLVIALAGLTNKTTIQ